MKYCMHGAVIVALLLSVACVACQGLLGVDFSDARSVEDAAAQPVDAVDAGDGGDAGTVPPDPGCQATCKTGCCAGSVCKPGNANDACGLGGSACAACGDLATCNANACVRSVVLFGGMTSDPDAGTSRYFDDTWLWDGQSWRQAPSKSSPPPARSEMSIAALNGDVLLYGGANINEQPTGLGDTWSFSATGLWKDTKATSGPYGRQSAPMAHLGTKLFLFGGWDYDDIGTSPGNWIDETWEWDGQFWTQHMVPGPTGRRNAALAPLSGKLVLFGGSDKNDNLLADTWEWDGNGWTPRMPAQSPPGRAYHSMATLGNKVVMFGGDLGGNRVWEWDGTTWTSHLVLGPAPRVGASMVAFGGKIVLFGGQGAGGKYLNDTWEWDGAKWTQRKVTGPSARMLQGMVTP